MVAGDRRRPARSTSSSDMSPPQLLDDWRIKPSRARRRAPSTLPMLALPIRDGAAASADAASAVARASKRQRGDAVPDSEAQALQDDLRRIASGPLMDWIKPPTR